MDSSNSGPSESKTPPRAPGDRLRRSAVLAAAALGAGGASLGVAAIADAGSGSSKTTATVTAVAHRPFLGSRPGTVGTVKSVGSDSFTITTPDSTTVTVDVSGSTKYQDGEKSSASLADVTVGERVAVQGSDTSNTVAAASVFIGDADGFRGPGGWAGGSGGPGTVGTVKSVGSDSFTITTPDSTTVTVDVSGSTKYQDGEKSSASLADVTVGERVAVQGSDTSNTVAATSVFIGDADGFRGPGGWAS